MISNINTKVSCDLPDCRNKAVYAVPLKGRGAALYLCADCLDRLAFALNAVRTPRGLKNRIKKVLDDKQNADKPLA